MSFASDLKSQIVSDNSIGACCRRALLLGVLFAKGTIENNGAISFNIESDEYADFLKSLIYEQYAKDSDISRPQSGGRCRVVSFNSKAAHKYLSRLESCTDAIEAKCSGCRSAFLRGVFFASGRICDPKKQYLLEFSPILRADKFIEMMSESGIDLKTTYRNEKQILYVKKSSMIEDFLALSALNDAVFELMNVKIASELRNNANRVANCEMNNIDRAVSASSRQLAVLDELDKCKMLSSLPEELEKTARLRLRHRDLSIPQLALISVPPISKSGLTHRMKRIMELAAGMLSQK